MAETCTHTHSLSLFYGKQYRRETIGAKNDIALKRSEKFPNTGIVYGPSLLMLLAACGGGGGGGGVPVIAEQDIQTEDIEPDNSPHHQNPKSPHKNQPRLASATARQMR